MKRTRISLIEDPAIARVREQALKITAKPKAKRKRKDREPRVCLCGCDELTKGGVYISGHNGKLLSRMVKEMRAQEVA